MKYKTAHNMASNLRTLADFIEEYGHELPSNYGTDPEVVLSIPASSKKKMRNSAKTLAKAGMVTKDFSTSYANLVKKFGNHVKVEVWSSRDKVCTAKVTGTKLVPVQRYVETGEFRKEDVIEWECDPIIADV